MMLKKERNGMLKNKIDQIRSTRNVINQVMDRIVTCTASKIWIEYVEE